MKSSTHNVKIEEKIEVPVYTLEELSRIFKNKGEYLVYSTDKKS